MDNFNLQNFVKKSKDEFYTKLYESKKKHSMEEEMHDEDHKMEENHQSLDNEVADRIEGLLNIPMKAKFLSAGVDLINDLLEDEPFDVEDVVSHLANELTDGWVVNDKSAEEVYEEKEEMVKEEEGDEEVEIEDEVEVPAEVDVEMEAPTKEPDNKEVFSQLVDAYEAAKELGDEKLTRQLANTITYFNKTIIFGDEE